MSVTENEWTPGTLYWFEAEVKRLTATLEYAVDVLQSIEMGYNDRTDEKLDLDEVKELAGYLLESIKKTLAESHGGHGDD